MNHDIDPRDMRERPGQVAQTVVKAIELMRDARFEEAEGMLAEYNDLTKHQDDIAVDLQQACRLAQQDEGEVDEETLDKLLGSKHLARVYETVSHGVGALGARIAASDVIDTEKWLKMLASTKEKAVILTDREHLEAYRKRGAALLKAIGAKLPGRSNDENL